MATGQTASGMQTRTSRSERHPAHRFGTDYTYDAAGNLTEACPDSYTWDYASR